LLSLVTMGQRLVLAKFCWKLTQFKCCSFAIQLGSWRVTVWNNVIAFAAFISVIFMLLKLRQSRRSTELLPIYIYFLVFTTVSFIIVLITNLLESAVQPSGTVLHDAAKSIFFVLRSGPQWFVQIAVVVFMFQPDVEKRWIIRTILISAALTVLFVTTTIVSSTVGDSHIGWTGLVRHVFATLEAVYVVNGSSGHRWL
jgi:hypothetical protein